MADFYIAAMLLNGVSGISLKAQAQAQAKKPTIAARCFGVSVRPNGQVRFGVVLGFCWEPSGEMERLTAAIKPVTRVSAAVPQFLRQGRQMKTGRNKPCHSARGFNLSAHPRPPLAFYCSL
ncbi:MAG: hypothetical protein E7J78_03365 [Pantoea sp.]|jgi:hypothetical protein|nr:hypothetical protein [Pantoea sp.]